MAKYPILYVLHDVYVEGRMNDGSIFYIDLEDFEKVSKYYWHNERGYAKTSKNKTTMHRLILGLTGDKDKRYKIEVDHINRNRMDNRKSNLRLVTRQENMNNKSVYKNNKSGVPGVKWNKKLEKWQVQITINKVRKHLGVFENLEDAINARLNAEKDK